MTHTLSMQIRYNRQKLSKYSLHLMRGHHLIQHLIRQVLLSQGSKESGLYCVTYSSVGLILFSEYLNHTVQMFMSQTQDLIYHVFTLR